MKIKLLFVSALALIVAVIGAATATATPPVGLTSELLARGAAGEFSIKSRNFDLEIKAKDATDPGHGQGNAHRQRVHRLA